MENFTAQVSAQILDLRKPINGQKQLILSERHGLLLILARNSGSYEMRATISFPSSS